MYTQMETENDTFLFIKEKLTRPKEAAKAATVNYNTVRKWKQIYDQEPEKMRHQTPLSISR